MGKNPSAFSGVIQRKPSISTNVLTNDIGQATSTPKRSAPFATEETCIEFPQLGLLPLFAPIAFIQRKCSSVWSSYS